MTRRPVLPGASELFRRTDTPPTEADVTELPSASAMASSPALRSKRDETAGGSPSMPLMLVPGGAAPPGDAAPGHRGTPAVPAAAALQPTGPLKRGRPARGRAERTRHDEKITVYLSAEELLALESARLTLRAHHGLAADRGRIVREAVSVLLADLTEHGEESVLVRRLKGARPPGH